MFILDTAGIDLPLIWFFIITMDSQLYTLYKTYVPLILSILPMSLLLCWLPFEYTKRIVLLSIVCFVMWYSSNQCWLVTENLFYFSDIKVER